MLGHFNHGKTTLLDNLAGTNFVSIEKHGITQIIRTRTVGIDSVPVTIVDTPGQDIFYRMRNYGASVADLVVLVVALDDGICPQTEECIGVAESIGCPVLVCINKIDMPSLADGLQGRVAKLQSQLREYDILENAMIVPISALTGAGVSVFKQSIVSMANALPAEGGEHAAYSSSTPMATRHGTVINSWVSQRDGVQLHVVIREGEIKVIFFNSGYGRVVKSGNGVFTDERLVLKRWLGRIHRIH